jgi:type I restriction enzyme S subunit
MDKIKNIPSLRFPEFGDKWTVKKLGEISNKIGDGLHGTPIYSDDSDIYFINGNNLSNGKIQINENTKKVDNSIFKKNDKGLNNNTILVSINGTIGNIAKYNNEKIMLGKSVGYYNFETNSDYYYHYFHTDIIQNFFISELTGSTIKNLSLKTLRETKISYPTQSEQTKIAIFLTTVDDKLKALKQKKTLLEQYKKGVMQKIFSQKIRFKDDNGNDYPDWEEKKLGDIGETYNGLTGKTKENFGSGKSYIQYKQIFDDSKIDISRFELVEISPTEKQNKVLFGDVFFTVSSETPNEIGMSSVLLDEIEELYLNSFCFGFRANSMTTLSPYFSKYLFRCEIIRNQIIKLAQGSTRFNMSKVQLMKLMIYLPTIEEQTKIANFLSAIDDKIKNCSAQIANTEVWKKGLLQQMFA